MDKTPIIVLFQKYLNNQVNEEELRELLRYFAHSEADDNLTPLIKRELASMEPSEETTSVKAIADLAERRIIKRTDPVQATRSSPKPRVLRFWIRVAAAVLIVAAGGTYLYFNEANRWSVGTSLMADIAPGSNQATLTLADGRVIDLSKEQSGIVVGDGITYVDGTQVLDDRRESSAPDVSTLMSLSTPRGGQYQITLPDGTKVWLNAASSLRYPTRFVGSERVVELDGEGYFEVAKNTEQPFLVKSKGQIVQVVGTAFNICAYGDEPQVTTTLAEGIIAIGSEAQVAEPTVMKPGQQAAYRYGRFEIADVDVEDYVAWKDGRFVFYGESMPLVARQIERWYDVSFEHQELATDIELWGSVSRDVMLSEILEVIELNTPLTFEREGRRIAIRKK